MYFIASSFLIWVSYKAFFYNEFLSHIKIIYWLLPTIIALLSSFFLFKLCKKHKGRTLNTLVIFIFCLTTTNLFSTLFVLCDPGKNTPKYITGVILIINSLIIYFTSKHLTKITVNLNKWIIVLITCIVMYGNYFYSHSINMLYDYWFY